MINITILFGRKLIPVDNLNRKETEMNKEQIEMLVDNALSEIFEDEDDEIEEGGPGSGRYPAGSGKGNSRERKGSHGGKMKPSKAMAKASKVKVKRPKRADVRYASRLATATPKDHPQFRIRHEKAARLTKKFAATAKNKKDKIAFKADQRDHEWQSR